MVAETVRLNSTEGQYDQLMPVTKPVAHESHYLVKDLDVKVAPTVTTMIGLHLLRACELLHKKYDKFFPGVDARCSQLYHGGGSGQWTPPEPIIGRGSGDYYPSDECEMFTGNQYFTGASKPKPGTPFILKNPKNGRAVVLCMGYEVGPGAKKFGGGASTEALYYLDAQHGTVLTLGRAADSKLAYGPLECE